MILLRRFHDLTHHRKGLVVAVLAAIVFGLYPAASRAAYADGGNAVCMILVTAWMRGLGMAFACLLRRAPLYHSKKDIKNALIGGFFQACSNLGIFLSLLYIPGPLVIIIVFTHTLMLLFFMAWRGELKLDTVNVLTTILALLGLTLVLDVWNIQTETHWIGMGLAFISALATLFRLYIYGQQTKNRNAMVVGAENLLIAGLLVLPVMLFQMPHLPLSWTGNFYVLASGLSLTLGSFLMFWGISLLGAFQYSLMAKLEPIFTSLFSVLVLNEVLGTNQYIGIVLVIGSLIAYQLLVEKKKRKIAQFAV